MKQQSVVAQTMRQTELPALPDSWVIHKISVKMLRPQNTVCPHIFLQNVTCFGLLTICQVLFCLLQNFVPVGYDKLAEGPGNRNVRTASGMYVMDAGRIHKPRDTQTHV